MNGSKIIEGAKEALAWTKGEGTARVTMPGQPAREYTVEQFHRHDELLRERAELEAANAAAGQWGAAITARLERIRAIDAALAANDLG